MSNQGKQHQTKLFGWVFISMIILGTLMQIQPAQANIFKWIRINKMNDGIFDSGDQSRPMGSWSQVYYDDQRWVENRAWRVGVRDWTDENSAVWPYKTTGHDVYSADEQLDIMPIPFEDGLTIKRYVRYDRPTITVQGDVWSEFFPRGGDFIDPAYIDASGAPGADELIESYIQTVLGIVIHQKVYAFSTKNHDDYIIYDWTFTNSTGTYANGAGNTVNLPEQTLKDVYFTLSAWLRIDSGPGVTGTMFGWSSVYGEQEGDSLDIIYNYPSWNKGQTYDTFGNPHPVTAYLQQTAYCGFGLLHADTDANNTAHDATQPCVTASGLQKFTFSAQHLQSDPLVCENEYAYMEYGFPNILEGQKAWYFDLNTDPRETRVKYQTRMDERHIKFVADATNGRGAVYMVVGPYPELKPGEDLRIVWCVVGGSISREKRWEIGRAWQNGTATWDGDDKIPPVGQAYPELIPSDNDRAKDNWVATGKDSLLKNVSNALHAVRNGYNIPKPPPAPSIEVWGRPDKIEILWGTESEAASDFKGYRVYRAVGSPDTTWEKIYEVEGTAVHSYDDKDAQRGFAYYYYVSAFDDGSQNQPGIENGIVQGQSVESGPFYNRTLEPAYLTRPSGVSLDDIRIIPNPYSIAASTAGRQFPGEQDKILFVNLPPECTIRIFSQSGDLLKTLEHTDGSGDEAWEDLTTTSDQIIVSGIYIAHIKTPTGDSSITKFVIVR
jgi:hypothetical protein